MNIYLLLSQTKKEFANRKSKLQKQIAKQHQIAKRETFAKERERERERAFGNRSLQTQDGRRYFFERRGGASKFTYHQEFEIGHCLIDM
jgi:hypothetical protein